MLVVLLTIFSAHSIISENNMISINPYSFQNIVWFGFENGGFISLNVSVDYPEFQVKADNFVLLFLCTPKEFNSLGYLADLCKKQTSIFSNSSRIEYKSSINKYITYELVLSNQNNVTVNLTVSYQITNPGGEQLSAGVLEMKYITLVFAITWGLMFILWLLKWLIGNRKQPSLIQFFLILNCFIWCVFSSIFNYYLHDYSIRGVSDFKLFMLSKVLMFVSMICLFVLLELISSSVGITKTIFLTAAKLKIAGLVLVYTAWFVLSETLYGDYIFFLLSGIYALFFVVYLVDIRRTLNELETEIEKMMDEGKEVIDSNIWHQIRMFRIHLISLFIFSAVLAGVSGFYQYYKYIPWVGMGTQIYTIFIWIFMLSIYFRFRPDSPYLAGV